MWELCRAAATEQDSSKVMELVAEIIKDSITWSLATATCVAPSLDHARMAATSRPCESRADGSA